MVEITGQWVEFRFYRPEAKQVHVTGDFNDWRDGELPMLRTADGYWVARVRLPAGEFRFRYCADGQWYTDFAAFGVTPGRFGLDSVVRVAAVPARIVEAASGPATEIAAA
ncbi:MAG: glycogen-binding domain-containing protein [Planctomycetota bacterium]|jgi:1,4-alpha-glucan branching enzyme